MTISVVAARAHQLGLEPSGVVGVGERVDPVRRRWRTGPVAGLARPRAEPDREDASMSVKQPG